MTPDLPAIRAAADELGCEWIDENQVYGFSKAATPFRRDGYELSGWLFQQFLKWGEHLSREEFYFVIDADTALNRPQAFRMRGDSGRTKTLLLESDEAADRYRGTFTELLGFSAPHPRSFIAHQMLFERAKVRALKAEIEARAGRTWVEAIQAALAEDSARSFSEYETYGNWLVKRFPDEVTVRYWSNMALDRSRWTGSADPLAGTGWRKPLLKRCRSISWHSYDIPRVP